MIIGIKEVKYKMKVLVTGSTGFIGNHVVLELIRQGLEVIATSKDEKKAKDYEWYSKVRYLPYDLNGTNSNYFEYFHKPDLLLHLAWEGLPHYEALQHLEENLFSNYRFTSAMIRNGLKKIVVTGTCLEYGLQNGPLNEDLETKPVTSYALAKDTLRKFLEQLQTKINFDLKWLRLFYLYGKGQNPDSIIPQLEKTLDTGEASFNMSGGEQLRDYLPVETVAEYIVHIALQKRITGVINCCSGTPISIINLINNIIEKKRKKVNLNLGYYPYLDYEPMAFWGDTRKLSIALGGK